MRPSALSGEGRVQPGQTRPARRAPPRAGAAAAKVFAALAKKTKYADPELIGHWPTIVGAEAAHLCRPGRITGTRTGRTLEIFTATGAAAAETQMRADDIIVRVNRFLGPGAVARIVIRQSGGKAKEPAAAAAPEDPSPLGQALSSFRSAVARRNRSD